MLIDFQTDKPELSLTLDGKGKAAFLCPKEKLPVLSELKDGKYVVEIKQYRERRSLDSNAYFWVLVGAIADKIHTDNDSVYLTELERYGAFTFVVVRKEAVERLKGEWRLVKELGEVSVNGTIGTQLQCFYGSHGYDKKEMSRLIDGTVQDAKELGIDTRTPEEIAILKAKWGEE